MHFSWKFRPWEFNATGDRIQRIDDVTTFLYLTANEFSLYRSARATSSSDHASVIPTDDISLFRRSRRLSTSDAIRRVFMFRVRAILKGLQRGHLFLFANVCELRLSGKHVRSQTTSLVLFGFQVDQQIAIWSTGGVLIGFYRKL